MDDSNTNLELKYKNPQQNEARLAITAKFISNLRQKLLDLTMRNHLLNYRFSSTSRDQIRVIDELPDQLYEKIIEGSELTIDQLPERKTSTKDEESKEFKSRLEILRFSDTEFLEKMKKVETGELEESETPKIERLLKNKVRSLLNSKPFIDKNEMSIEDYAKELGLNPSFDLPETSKKNSQKHKDNKIQTLEFQDNLERKLSGIRDKARTALSEMGVNTLYIAFGFIEWYESDSSDKKRFSPLLLHEISINRTVKKNKYEYRINSLGNETQINLSLKEKLKSDFDLSLPEIKEDDSPGKYFKKIRRLIKSKPRWEIRKFVVIGNFRFSRLAMYEDLNPENWPEDSLNNHHILNELFSGSENEKTNSIGKSEEYEVDKPDISEIIPCLVTEADSSQFSALVDICKGKNLVIQGPPGTGKSQTITNLIGAYLKLNKRVLFVAEKMAALEVVKKRLDDLELGEFCLELHSTHTKKTEVLETLKSSISLRENLKIPRNHFKNLETTKETHGQYIDYLSKYVSLIGQEFKETGQTTHELLWDEINSRINWENKNLGTDIKEFEEEIKNIWAETPEEKLGNDLTRQISKLNDLEENNNEIITRYEKTRNHPWHGIHSTSLDIYSAQEVVAKLKAWKESIKILFKVFKEETELLLENKKSGKEEVLSINDIKSFSNSIENPPEPFPDLDIQILKKITSKTKKTIEQFINNSKNLWNLSNSLSNYSDNPIKDISDLSQKLDLSKDLDSEWFIQYSKEPIHLLSTLYPSDTIEGIQKLIDNNESKKTEIEPFLELSSRISDLSTFNEFLTITDLKELILVFKYLENCEIPSLLNEESILSESNCNYVKNKAKELKQIQLKYKELCIHYDISKELKRSDLAGYKYTLTNTGIIKRIFSRPFKEAKEYFNSISMVPHKIKNHKIMAEEITKILECLNQIHEFKTDARLKGIFQDRFYDIDTPVEEFIEDCKFIQDLYNFFEPLNSFKEKIRNKFSKMSQKKLLEIKKVSKTHEFKAFANWILNSEEKLILEKWELKDLYDFRNSCVVLLKKLKGQTSRFSFKKTMKLSEIIPTFTLLKESYEIMEVLKNDKNGNDFLGEYSKLDEKTTESLVTNLAWTEKIEDTKLPPTIKNDLLYDNPYEGVEKLKKCFEKIKHELNTEENTRKSFENLSNLNIPEFFNSEDNSNFSFLNINETLIIKRIDFAIENEHELIQWSVYSSDKEDCDKSTVKSILELFDKRDLKYSILGEIYKHIIYRSTLSEFFKKNKMGKFTGKKVETMRQGFAYYDKELQEISKKDIAADLARDHVSPGIGTGKISEYTQLSLIRHEISKKKRHIALR
ncbi:MAG: DUF4011 domain-containing protein, partial [bacterium]